MRGVKTQLNRAGVFAHFGVVPQKNFSLPANKHLDLITPKELQIRILESVFGARKDLQN